MSALTMPAQRQSPALLLLVLAGLIALAAVASHVTATSHAVAKHGADLANYARNCSDQNRVNSTWTSNQRGTMAETCLMPGAEAWEQDARWTVRIISRLTGEEITVFGHTGDVASLEEYMIRQLYVFLQ